MQILQKIWNFPILSWECWCSYLSAEEREGLWCPLFDQLLQPLQTAVTRQASAQHVEKWREMLRHVISAMLGHVGHKKERAV